MDLISIIILVATTVAVGWVTVFLFRKSPEVEEEERDDGSQKAGQNGTSKVKRQGQGNQASESKKSTKAGKKGTQQQSSSKEKFTHSWLVSTLKGHSGNILGIDLSPNNKFLASCADDRTVYVWFTKDFADRDHKSIRVNIPFDHAYSIRWSPDSKAFIIARKEEKMLEVFKLGRKPDNSIGNITSALQWPQSSSELIGLGIACNGKFIMSCGSDGKVELREPKGAILKTFLCGQSNPIETRISPCGRFIAVAGPQDIEMFEVKTNPSSGNMEEPALKWKIPVGKGAKIASFAFNTDSSKLAVVREDGNWLLFDTTGSRVNAETQGRLEECNESPKIALSGDSHVVAIGTNGSLYLFSAFSGELLDQVLDIYKGSVACVEFSADSRYVIIAGDNMINIFQNVSWYKETVKRLKSQLQDATVTGSMRKRLASELSSYEDDLKKF